ncbi:hypothetical protein Q8F55_006069 [Vanrija albida]|uniref:Uncharacterized protein n=1 Tax=Vanrija albida TaxID=181172 RepID=A0ABR3Q3L2_9TREE
MLFSSVAALTLAALATATPVARRDDASGVFHKGDTINIPGVGVIVPAPNNKRDGDSSTVSERAGEANGLFHKGDTISIPGVGVIVPAPGIANNKRDDNSSSTVSERDDADYSGFSVRCFDGAKCQGRQLHSYEDRKSGRGGTFGYYFEHPYDRPLSCRFDVWNGFDAKIWMSGLPEGTPKEVGLWQENISKVKYTNGPGQYCVDQFPVEKWPQSVKPREGIKIFRLPLIKRL